MTELVASRAFAGIGGGGMQTYVLFYAIRRNFADVSLQDSQHNYVRRCSASKSWNVARQCPILDSSNFVSDSEQEC